jgi:hypothetical protein
MMLIYLLYLTRKKEDDHGEAVPRIPWHGMAMLYLATPSLQPLHDGLVERAVEGFY